MSDAEAKKRLTRNGPSEIEQKKTNASLTLLGYWSLADAFAYIGTCALAEIIFHFRSILQIERPTEKRARLQLIVFSTRLLSIMSIGTIWSMESSRCDVLTSIYRK